MCGCVIKCTCALQPNDCLEICALNANRLLFVLIELKRLFPFCCTNNWWFTISSKVKCYNHARISDVTAVFVEIFLEQISR